MTNARKQPRVVFYSQTRSCKCNARQNGIRVRVHRALSCATLAQNKAIPGATPAEVEIGRRRECTRMPAKLIIRLVKLPIVGLDLQVGMIPSWASVPIDPHTYLLRGT